MWNSLKAKLESFFLSLNLLLMLVMGNEFAEGELGDGIDLGDGGGDGGGDSGAVDVDNGVDSPNTGYFDKFTELIEDDESEEAPEIPIVKPNTEDQNTTKPDPKPGDENKGDGDEAPTYLDRFYENAEDGTRSFKADEALDNLFPGADSDHAFKFSPISVISEEEAAKREPGADPSEPKTAKEAYTSFRTEMKELSDKMMTPFTNYQKYINEGHSENDAIRKSYQDAKDHLSEYEAEQKAEFESNWFEKMEGRSGETAASKALNQQCATNEARMHSLFNNADGKGGKEEFNSLFFASKGKDGKMNPGVCSEDLWQVFKLANPGVENKKLTSGELSKEMGQWWPKFASSWDNMLWLKKIGMATLFEKTKGQFVEHVRNVQTGQNKKLQKGKMNNPKLSTTPKPGPVGNDAWDSFMDPTSARGVPSV